MIRRPPIREPARILFHLNEGFTRILFERTEGLGIANGGAEWDIPTSLIPPNLRRIGSRFMIDSASIWPEPGDTAEELRAAIYEIRIEELTPP